MPRFAANLGLLFPDRPLIERFEAAAKAGFTAVEAQFPYEYPASAVKAQLEKHGLAMLGINTATGRPGESGLGAVAGREQDFAALFLQALDYVVEIGGTAIHCMAGTVPPDQQAVADRTFISNLAALADLAAEKNIMLLIEPLNTRDRPGYALTRVEQAAEIIRATGKSNIRIQFDFYHLQINQGDLLTRFEKHFDLIGHVQVAAVPSRHEPDEGELNFPEIYKALDAIGYKGWIGAEYNPRGRTEDGLGWARSYGIVPRS
jgi:hydroxypyruvate isomerase